MAEEKRVEERRLKQATITRTVVVSELNGGRQAGKRAPCTHDPGLGTTLSQLVKSSGEELQKLIKIDLMQVPMNGLLALCPIGLIVCPTDGSTDRPTDRLMLG